MQPQNQTTTTSTDLKSFISDLQKDHPRDTEYVTHLFLNFLILHIVKEMPEDKLKEVIEKKDKDPKSVIEVLGNFCKTTDICSKTIEEFKELL